MREKAGKLGCTRHAAFHLGAFAGNCCARVLCVQRHGIGVVVSSFMVVYIMENNDFFMYIIHKNIASQQSHKWKPHTTHKQQQQTPSIMDAQQHHHHQPPPVHVPNVGLSSILPHVPLPVATLPAMGVPEASLQGKMLASDPITPSPSTLQRVADLLNATDTSYVYVCCID